MFCHLSMQQLPRCRPRTCSVLGLPLQFRSGSEQLATRLWDLEVTESIRISSDVGDSWRSYVGLSARKCSSTMVRSWLGSRFLRLERQPGWWNALKARANKKDSKCMELNYHRWASNTLEATVNTKVKSCGPLFLASLFCRHADAGRALLSGSSSVFAAVAFHAQEESRPRQQTHRRPTLKPAQVWGRLTGLSLSNT